MTNYEQLRELYNWGQAKGACFWGYSYIQFCNSVVAIYRFGEGIIAFSRDPNDALIWWAHVYSPNDWIGLNNYKEVIDKTLAMGCKALRAACINPKIESLCKKLDWIEIDSDNEIKIFEKKNGRN